MTDRSLAIVAVIAIILVVGGLLVRGWLRDAAPEEAPASAPVVVEDKTHTGVRVRVTNCQRDRDHGGTVMSGYVLNTGNVDLHYVTVKSLWKDENGLLVSSDTLYALNNSVLKPGEQRPFTDVNEHLGVARCNAEAMDWW